MKLKIFLAVLMSTSVFIGFNFALAQSAPSVTQYITITYPTSSSVWTIKRANYIRWKEEGVDSVDITLTNTATSVTSTLHSKVSASRDYYLWRLSTALTPGTYTITVSDSTNSAVSNTSSPFQVVLNVNSINVSGTDLLTKVAMGSTLQMNATVLPANATNTAVTWSVASGTGSANIDSVTGMLTPTSVGTVTVKATAKDGSGVKATKKITVVSAGSILNTPSNASVKSAVVSNNTAATANINTSQNCVSLWSCTTWSSCSNNQQTRTCVDLRNCAVPNGYAASKQACSSCNPAMPTAQSCCNPAWSQSSFGPCINGVQAINWVDENNCGMVAFNSPPMTQPTQSCCTPNWQCSTWSTTCTNGQQTRTCTDLNNCSNNCTNNQYGNCGIINIQSPATTQQCLPVTVTSPAGGEVWKSGETHNITWSNTDQQNNYVTGIILQAYDINGNLSMPAGVFGSNLYSENSLDWNMAPKGSYSWTVTDPSYKGYSYKVAVNYAGSGGSMAYSNPFYIVPTNCTPNWSCTLWTQCINPNGQQTRTCTDLNNCGTTPPDTTNSCQNPESTEQYYQCVPNWQCGNWSTCANNQQARNCTDMNSCQMYTGQVPTGEPAITQKCSSATCTYNWQCGNWSTCANGQQTRICTDLNNCNNISQTVYGTWPLTKYWCSATDYQPDHVCVPNWQCGSFGACNYYGWQYRTCTDLNNCDPHNVGDPGTSQQCTVSASGTSYAGYKWYIGSGSESCNQVCADHGGICDATGTAFGAGNGNVFSATANCKSVLSALGVSTANFLGNDYAAVDAGMGCYVNSSSGAGSVASGATCYSANANMSRICACDTASAPANCTPNWQCSDWDTCTNGQQSRTCIDSNSCGTTQNKPLTAQSCGCIQNWNCSYIGFCVNGKQSISGCIDLNRCGYTTPAPSSQPCTNSNNATPVV